MATKTIAWNTGTGNITVVYGGSGDGTATITSSDNDLYEARSQQITFQTTAGSPQRTVTVTVAQAAKQRIDLSNAIVTAANQTYSGSALTPVPTVTLNGDTVPSTGYDVTYSNNTNAGTATITITGKGDYTGTAIGTFTIAKADPTYTQPTGYSYTYNRSARSLITTGSTNDGTIQYSGDGTTWSTTRPTATNAGTYTAYWRLIGDANHNDVAKSAVTTTIAKATPVINVSPSLVTGLTYNTSAQKLLSGGSVKHSSTDSTVVVGTFTYQEETNAGTYNNPTWAFTPTDTTNYNSISGSVTGSVVIAQATGQVTTLPTARSVTYSGSAQYLVTAGSGTGTMQYRYKLSTSSTWSSWSKTRARSTNAGTYNVQYRAAASSDGNYTVSAVGELNVTMAKRTPVVNVAPALATGLVYTGSALDLLTGGSMKHSSSSSTAVAGTFTYTQQTNAGTYSNPTWSFVPTDSVNYNNASGTVTGSVSIGKAASSVTAAPTAKTGQTYNGSAKTLVNAGTVSGGTMYYYATTTNSKPSSTTSFTTTIPTKTNAGTYYVWYYVKGDSNHNDTAISSTAVSVTIAKANRTISFTTAPTSVEIGATITVVAAPSAGSGDGTITYSSNDTSKATVSGNVVTGVGVGTVNITATISAGTNYNSATTSYSLGVTEIIYENHYLTFTALETCTFTFTNHGSGNNIQYSINGGSTWVSLASATASPSVSAGSKIMWKSTRTPGNANNNYGVGTFSSTGRFDVEGNAMSLLFGDDFIGKVSLSGKSGALGTLFEGCTTIVDASNMKLPATTTVANCYLRMFLNCSSLVSPPSLPATALVGAQCYYEMFRGCTALTVAPQLPATTLTSYCYYQMFMSCSSLVQVQEELPATTLQTQCYYHMYDGCSALLVAPKLPATTLTSACYGGMFRNCTSLAAAPDLCALTLTTNCYSSMFTGCTNLNYIKCLATDISASNCTLSWMYQTKSGGTFVKNASMSDWPRNNNGIPSSWTVETAPS